jgi:YD repeat-containing protein
MNYSGEWDEGSAFGQSRDPGGAGGGNLNLLPAFGPGQCDFPPISLDPQDSSAPLVSGEVRHFRGPTPFRERATHHGIVDLMTGIPLVQEIDFELPFGGAVFRHVRTHSRTASALPTGAKTGYFFGTDHPVSSGPEAFWDWNGLHWCMSENPILLIDAAYAYEHQTADPPQEYLADLFKPGTRRCYFIPDAHHEVPFIRHGTSENYACPPWFDGALSHNGGIVGADGAWEVPPTEFYVWTHRRSIKYTFKPYYEDLWVENGVSVHSPPPTSYGLPFYALVTQIEDRYGNSIEYEYCDFVQEPDDAPNTLCCNECRQKCNEKGQLRSLRLRTASGQIAYTLIYAHRNFKSEGHTSWSGFLNYPRNQNALHTIHVYEGDAAWAPSSGCFTLGYELFCNAQSLEEIDALNLPLIEQHPEWLLEARYLYSEKRETHLQTYMPWPMPSPYCPGGDLTGSTANTEFPAYVIDPVTGEERELFYDRQGQLLLKTTITKKLPESVTGEVERSYAMYRYENGARLFFDDNIIKGVIEAMRLESGDNAIGPNSLFKLRESDGYDVPYINPSDGMIKHKSLHELANWGWTGNARSLPLNHLSINGITPAFVNWLGADPSRTKKAVFEYDQSVTVLSDRRMGHDHGDYALYHFVTYPSGVPADASTEQGSIMFSFRHPTRMRGNTWDTFFQYFDTRLDEVFVTAVIDEIADRNFYHPDLRTGLRSRRVVEMNPAGFVMRDRTWRFSEDGQGQVVQESGNAETFISDCKGRIIERRTTGWGAASTPESEGLIRVYEYEDPCCTWSAANQRCDCQGLPCTTSEDEPGELIAEGIKKGTDGQVRYLRRFEGDTRRPELIAKEVRYPTPAQGSAGSIVDPPDAEIIETNFVLEDEPGVADRDKKIVEKTVKRPAALIESGGNLAHAVTKTHYNTEGNLDYAGDGTVDTSGVALEFYVTKLEYETTGSGQLIKQTQDYDGADIPLGFERLSPAGAPALAYITSYVPNPLWGRLRTFYPNGRQLKTAYVEADDGLYQWTFDNLIEHKYPEEPAPFEVLSPVVVKFFKGGQLQWQKTAQLLVTDMEPEGVGLNCEDLVIYDTEENPYPGLISVSTPTFDSHGRIVGMKTVGKDNNQLAASIAYDGFGHVGRQADPDGTITRNVYDELGRLQRVYRGTNDEHDYWGTAEPCNPPGDPNCTFPDNLTLVEKRYYGTGVTDAQQLTTVRRFRDTPENQYGDTGPDPENPIDPSNEDQIGWVNEYSYDWRMRPVVEIRKNEAGEVINQTLTWYDNLDRQRFVAEYATDAPLGWPNPTALAATSPEPTGAEILASSPAPYALTEYIYNLRGQVEETRQYNVASGASATYTATITFNNHRDQPTEVHSPGSPVTKQ